VVQVVGTNGKGTTAAALSEFLMASGRRVALFTSPHLLAVSERYRVSDRMAPLQELGEVYLATERVVEEYQLGHFETLCLVFVEWVRRLRQTPDVVILEAGVGGRWDPTTSLVRDQVLLTTLSLDHQAVLGETLDDIRQEKRGAMADVPQALAMRTPKVVWGEGPRLIDPPPVQFQNGRMRVELVPGQWSEASLFGRPAAHGLALAAASFEAIVGQPIHPSWASRVRWPGRFDIQDRGKSTWIFSGDHNAEGLQVLLQNWRDWSQGRPTLGSVVVILALTGGKLSAPIQASVVTLLAELARSGSGGVHVLLATPQFRSANETDLRWFAQCLNDQLSGQSVSIHLVESLSAAAASAVAQEPAVVLVTGSLYGVGEVMQWAGQSKQ
jgi:dihydrofolate synthase/folylpolyglutamate synthase